MGKVVKEVEDEFSAKLDLCITDGIVKSGGGMILGGVALLLFFGKRRWPIIAGMGIGIGIAYANCEFEMNSKRKANS